MITPGQAAALEQLDEIARASARILEIVSVEPPTDEVAYVRAVLSISCEAFVRAEGGLPLKSRERFDVFIPADFPFRVPSVHASHLRFDGFPHVQFGRSLCLYQSPATEWDPSDGMFGFVDRLSHWLERGALNEFEATGEPLHPPAIYPSADTPLFIPLVDTPPVADTPWVGLAKLESITDQRIDITGWSDPVSEPIPDRVAAAILVPAPLSWEFPRRGAPLIHALETAGVPKSLLLLVLTIATLRGDEHDPLYVVIGTPMRGIAGSAQLRQHLTVWRIPAERAHSLRTSLAREGDTEDLRNLRGQLRALTGDVIGLSEVDWCQVREDRPEIVTRRDAQTPMSWFLGKTIAVWGCGAVGAAVAEAVVRAGAKKILLFDKSAVAPGVVSRQPFEDLDIGIGKARALAARLQRIRPRDLEVVPKVYDVLDWPLGSGDWTASADIVIDASTSEAVLEKLELKRRESHSRVPVASLVVGHKATMGLVVLANDKFSGGPGDVARRTKIAVCNRDDLKMFADEFWPGAERRVPFQPEPGCSEPTFVGSWSDVMALTGAMLNCIAEDLSKIDRDAATAHVLMQPHVASADARLHATFTWQPDIVLEDPHADYEIRIARGAWRDARGWVETSRRRHGPAPETGGILFGERNEASRIIWVNEILGPPPDSEASEELFLCGISGVAAANDEKRVRTRGSVQIVGMWHTHPKCSPLFSATDFAGMEDIVTAKEPSSPKFLLLILGWTARPEPWSAGVYVFTRRDFADLRLGVSIRTVKVNRIPVSRGTGTIGLALSGGGSRAIAFHLGCLRALYDLAVMERVRVISGVSGGSVITAAYAYSGGTFAEFERDVRRVLRKGFAVGIARRTVLSRKAPRALATTVVAGGAALGARALRRLLSFSAGIVGKNATGEEDLASSIQPPLRRWYTRTHALEDTLKRELFRDIKLTDARRGGVDVVLNACELRTGTAFRFGSRESGNWRIGRLKDNNIPVAHAVAASAAYPALLPAFDEVLEFVDRQGDEKKRRVVLTDGGVFENLGVSCMEPDREFGYNTFSADFVVACDAGAGQFSGKEVPYGWMSRMQRSFETVFRKAHDATLKRLHTYVPAGRLRGFVLAYLGQLDRTLPMQPPDLVRREAVANYPTDFSSMTDQAIDELSMRGEQLVRLLIERYCPDM